MDLTSKPPTELPKGKDNSGRIIRYTAGAVLTLLVWAGLSPADPSTTAPATATASTKTKDITASESGQIREILVAAGAKVQAGQAMVQMDTTQLHHQLTVATDKLLQQRARKERLEAAIALRPPVFADDIAAGAPEVVRVEQQAYDTYLASARKRVEAAQATIEQQLRLIDGLRKEREFAQSVLQSSRRQLAMRQGGGEYVSASDREQAQSQVSISGKSVSEVDRAIGGAEAEIAKIKASVEADLTKEQSTMAIQVSEVSTEIDRLGQEKASIEHRIAAATLRASEDGIINELLTTSVGATVEAGRPLMRLVPSGDELVFEVRIKPRDIGYVQAGQEVKLALANFDQQQHGTLPARVVQVSAAQLREEGAKSTDDTYFRAIVRPEGNRLSGGTAVALAPGWQATAQIRLGEQTVLEYLLAAIRRVPSKAFSER